MMGVHRRFCKDKLVSAGALQMIVTKLLTTEPFEFVRSYLISYFIG